MTDLFGLEQATKRSNDRPEAADPRSWRELAAACHRHHFSCPTCVAAGQFRGLRCGTGMALWVQKNAS